MPYASMRTTTDLHRSASPHRRMGSSCWTTLASSLRCGGCGSTTAPFRRTTSSGCLSLSRRHQVVGEVGEPADS